MIATSMRRLEVFLAVAETGRFSQAADRLGIAQPSVSAHIAGLERQIGQSLFVRSPGRPPALSRAGQSLLNYVTDVLSKSRETAHALQQDLPMSVSQESPSRRSAALPITCCRRCSWIFMQRESGDQDLHEQRDPGERGLADHREPRRSGVVCSASAECRRRWSVTRSLRRWYRRARKGAAQQCRSRRVAELPVFYSAGCRLSALRNSSPPYCAGWARATRNTCSARRTCRVAVARRGIGILCTPLHPRGRHQGRAAETLPVTVLPIPLQIRARIPPNGSRFRTRLSDSPNFCGAATPGRPDLRSLASPGDSRAGHRPQPGL